MKTKLLTLFTVVLLSGIFYSCSEEDINPRQNQEEFTEGGGSEGNPVDSENGGIGS